MSGPSDARGGAAVLAVDRVRDWSCRGVRRTPTASGPTTETTAAKAAKVDDIANIGARGHQVLRQADRRGERPLHAQRVQGSERQDHRLRRRSDERDRVDPRSDRRLPRGRLRQDHPVDPGRHLQRRHVVVHRHQGARAAGRLRHLLLGGLAVGRVRRARTSIPTTPAARRSRCRPPRPRRSTNCLPGARRAPTRASRRSTSSSSTARTRPPTPSILGQADAMSADSPVTLVRDQAERRQARAGRRDLRLRALRLARHEGIRAGGGAAEGPRAPDRDRRLQADRGELGCRGRHDRQAGHQRRRPADQPGFVP